MNLNRYAVHSELEEERLDRNLRAAQYHARELLKITRTLLESHIEQHSVELSGICSTPFLGYSILSAVDILTSIGTLADLRSDIQLLQSSLIVVEELSKYWASAHQQLIRIAARFGQVMHVLESASVEAAVFITMNAIDDTVGVELDLLFSPPVTAKFKALGLGTSTRPGKGVLTIETLGTDIRDNGNRKEANRGNSRSGSSCAV